MHQEAGADKKHDHLLTRHTGSGAENAFSISVEDDDNSEDIIRKHKSLARHFLAFYYAFILNHRSSSSLAGGLPYHPYQSYTGSCKYIVQRTLRI
jgi:hypothetical protein